MRTLDEAPFVDFFDEDFRADPATVVNRLRPDGPVVRTPIGCMVISRELVHSLLSDPRLTTALPMMVGLQATEGPLRELVESSLLGMDGEGHARLRRLVNREFTPRAVERHRPLMAGLVDDLIGRFAAAGRCEFMVDFADQYPIQVICHLLGVPVEDHPLFARWGDALTHMLSLELSLHLEEVNQAQAELTSYIDDLVAQRQARPGDDLVSRLVAISEEGDRLSRSELRSMIGGLLFAGYDTTRNQLGRAMWLFCEHPDQWRLLTERLELIPAAVEEAMRLAGAIPATARIAAEELDLEGWRVPAGTMVTLSMAAANHDPAVFDEPDGFDITAERQAQLGFGGGPHYCLGANLARAEMQEALAVLSRRLADVALDGEPTWRSPSGIVGPIRLPLRFTPRT